MTTPQQTLDRLQATHMPVGSAVLDDCRRHLRRLAALESVIDEIREVTALHDVPPEDLPGLIEDIISAMASQNVWLTSRLPAHDVYDEAGQRREGPSPEAIAQECASHPLTIWPDDAADRAAGSEEDRP